MKRITATLAAAALLFGAGPAFASHGGEQYKEPETAPSPTAVVPCPEDGSVAQSPSHGSGTPSAVQGEVKVVPCPQEETAETRKETPQSGAQQPQQK